MLRHATAWMVMAAMVTGCNDNAPALPPVPDKTEPLTRLAFSIGGAQYAIALPERASMLHHGQDGVIFYASRSQRLQRTMTIEAKPRQAEQNFDREHFTRDARGRIDRDRTDRIVRYRHLGNTGEGSGGSMEDIAGRIQIGPNVLFFNCSDQSEGSIRADWCLDYIDSLVVSPPASSGNG